MLPRLPRNVVHAFGGVGIAVAIAFVAACLLLPEVRLVGAAKVGGSLFLLGWLVVALAGIFRSKYVVINTIAVVGFALWASLATALGLAPSFRETMLQVGIWLGGALIVALIVIFSIRAIRAKEETKKKNK